MFSLTPRPFACRAWVSESDCELLRVGLLRMLRRSGRSEFSAYRKFTVDTAATHQPPKVP